MTWKPPTTEAELEMIRALAAQVVNDRLGRMHFGAQADGGKYIKAEFLGEPTPAERHWFKHVLKPLPEFTVHGGPHQEGAQT